MADTSEIYIANWAKKIVRSVGRCEWRNQLRRHVLRKLDSSLNMWLVPYQTHKNHVNYEEEIRKVEVYMHTSACYLSMHSHPGCCTSERVPYRTLRWSKTAVLIQSSLCTTTSKNKYQITIQRGPKSGELLELDPYSLEWNTVLWFYRTEVSCFKWVRRSSSRHM